MAVPVSQSLSGEANREEDGNEADHPERDLL